MNRKSKDVFFPGIWVLWAINQKSIPWKRLTEQIGLILKASPSSQESLHVQATSAILEKEPPSALGLKDRFVDEVFEHQALIHKVCRMYRDGEEDRQDLFQEVMYQLWKSYPSFQGRSKISSWIYRISLNTAMATFRKPRKQFPEEYLPTEHENSEENLEDPREELLFAAIRKLNDSDRAVIALYLEGISYSEIADIIGINENNLGVRLNRIKKKLKELLNI